MATADVFPVTGALLTALFFSLSALFAQRSLRLVGPTRANLGRLVFALLVLGAYAHLFGGGWSGPGLGYFLLSGAIGMGLGDLAMFYALPLLGARLTVLMTQCLAVPIAIVAERVWLGTQPSFAATGWGIIILLGVVVALLPQKRALDVEKINLPGMFLGVLAAAGQGLGAVLSREAALSDVRHGQAIDGLTAAYQRIVGGLGITLLLLLLRRRFSRGASERSGPLTVRALGWIAANASCGAVIGVSCYQWALSTTPSGLVLPIVATTPLVIVPLAYWFEGERPSSRSLVGGMIAVAGVVALVLHTNAGRR